jgi:hypothetical protein
MNRAFPTTTILWGTFLKVTFRPRASVTLIVRSWGVEVVGVDARVGGTAAGAAGCVAGAVTLEGGCAPGAGVAWGVQAALTSRMINSSSDITLERIAISSFFLIDGWVCMPFK